MGAGPALARVYSVQLGGARAPLSSSLLALLGYELPARIETITGRNRSQRLRNAIPSPWLSAPPTLRPGAFQLPFLIHGNTPCLELKAAVGTRQAPNKHS